MGDAVAIGGTRPVAREFATILNNFGDQTMRSMRLKFKTYIVTNLETMRTQHSGPKLVISISMC